jgi:hypothetical protein
VQILGGNYEVSDHGDVRRTGSARNLRPFRQPRGGYLLVKPSIGGRAKNVTVHSLVAVAFLGARPHGAQVNHRDGNKSNNAASNLEYVTASENMAHAIRMGLRPPPSPVLDYRGQHWTQRRPEAIRGEKNARAKLTRSQVESMRWLRSCGIGLKRLAAEFRVSMSLAHNVVTRKSWAHIP